MFTAKSVFILFAIELEHSYNENMGSEDKEKIQKAIDLLKSKVDNNIHELTEEEFKIVDDAYSLINKKS